MSSSTAQPGLLGVLISAGPLVLLLIAARLNHLPLVRRGLVAAVRATLQLSLVGLVLGRVFELQAVLPVAAVLATMIATAAWTARSQIRQPLPKLGGTLAAVLATVTVGTLMLALRGALGLDGLPARYAIPLGGIVLGNAMTSATLAANHYLERISQDRHAVEAALGLGAAPAQADLSPFRSAFLTAVTPVLNAMLIVGIVKLPGIMSGQMLGGSSPFVAAQYQLMVMFMLAAGDGLTALWVLRLLRRQVFTPAWQLRQLD